MPILYFREQRFADSTKDAVTRVHRFAVFFGLVMPLVYWFASLILTRNLGSFWPSVIASTYEHAIFYGWAGIYTFGLLMYAVPQLLDHEVKGKERRLLDWSFLLYGLGVTLVCMSSFFSVFLPGSRLSLGFSFTGLIAEALGWTILCTRVVRWLFQHPKGLGQHEYMQIAGMLFFSAGIVVNIVLTIMLVTKQLSVVPVSWLFSLRTLPIAALILFIISMVMRMVPEMLGSRPADDQRLRMAYGVMFVAAVAVSIGYPLFHRFGGLLPAVIYGGGLFLAITSVALLLWVADIWQVRLTPPVNTEHVWYIYGSYFWLLLGTAILCVFGAWELFNNAAANQIWIETLSYAYLGGTIAFGLLGIYTYIINQLTASYRHTDRLAVFAFVILNWALLVRVFVYPFIYAQGWEGTNQFRWVVESLVWIGLAIISVDMYLGLFGNTWAMKKERLNKK